MRDGDLLAAFDALDGPALADALAAGHPVDPAALDDTRYLGVSLGMPGFVDRLAWKTFMKTFHRDPRTDELRGWNVRLEQTGWTAPPVPKTRGGEPVTFGHYQVVAPERPHRAPPGSLLLDYGLGGNALLDPARRLRDPLVALEPGSADLLLGWTWISLWGARIGTPSYFVLKRAGSLEHVARAPRTPLPAIARGAKAARTVAPDSS